jgi:hypothetical protein
MAFTCPIGRAGNLKAAAKVIGGVQDRKSGTVAQISLHFYRDSGFPERARNLVVVGQHAQTDCVKSFALLSKKLGIGALTGYRLDQLQSASAKNSDRDLQPTISVPQSFVAELDLSWLHVIELPGNSKNLRKAFRHFFRIMDYKAELDNLLVT